MFSPIGHGFAIQLCQLDNFKNDKKLQCLTICNELTFWFNFVAILQIDINSKPKVTKFSGKNKIKKKLLRGDPWKSFGTFQNLSYSLSVNSCPIGLKCFLCIFMELGPPYGLCYPIQSKRLVRPPWHQYQIDFTLAHRTWVCTR